MNRLKVLPIALFIAVFFPHVTFAANMTFTQTDWSGGATSATAVHPTNESGWTFSSSTSALTATTTIQIATTSLSTSEDFTTATHEDVASTSVTWDTVAHRLSIPTTTSTDLTTKIPNMSTGIYTLTYDPDNQRVYIAGDAGKFVEYNTSAATSTDLSTKISISASAIESIVYSSSNHAVYIGVFNGQFVEYNTVDATSTNLTAKIPAMSSGIYTLTYDPTGKMIYIGGVGGQYASAVPVCFSNCIGQSLNTNASSQKILSATLTKSDTPGSGTISYYLSNDGGVTFSLVTPGTPYIFTTSGNDLRWKAILNGNATTQSVSISYIFYTGSGTLTSSAYDTTTADNNIEGVSWVENATLPSHTTATFSLRTAASLSSLWTASYIDFTDASSTCLTVAGVVTCGSATIPSAYQTGSGNQWLQYKITLTSDGAHTPTLSSAQVTYGEPVVSTPPVVTTPPVTPASPSAISIPTGGSGLPNPLPGASTPIVATPATPSVLSAPQIQSVLDLLRAFGVDTSTIEQVTLALQGISITFPIAPLPVTSPPILTFTRNLSLHNTGEDVRALQQYLNSHNFLVAANGIGSPGKETIYFGLGTYHALLQFQEAHSLPISGFFGPKTRSIINKLP